MSNARRGLTFRGAKKTIDARGLKCPLPTLRAALALERLPARGRLVLRSDDPVTAREFPAWCREFNHTLIRTEERGGVTRFEIQKK
ncbi:MAG: sulfurtransferase TusA family protein [Elusimicrobia bacterium]|nr:sulfurtransferase TusA family protein [Elusimicrobiota bacterium]MBK7208458.1 sulfurtransferase TusA family protein [Elusimicrobiota bacterium]MBK7545218.1 sulfurtransferase TusA family protein [Elusimicrobiota bacterium]MBK7574740.1 sulfurtransferase TusA family protein [Elusimicrobiota bacterium]MBK7688687.1 sulfurtransferase TusA family protein [Elusimicrobiota bacterium]